MVFRIAITSAIHERVLGRIGLEVRDWVRGWGRGRVRVRGKGWGRFEFRGKTC